MKKEMKLELQVKVLEALKPVLDEMDDSVMCVNIHFNPGGNVSADIMANDDFKSRPPLPPAKDDLAFMARTVDRIASDLFPLGKGELDDDTISSATRFISSVSGLLSMMKVAGIDTSSLIKLLTD